MNTESLANQRRQHEFNGRHHLLRFSLMIARNIVRFLDGGNDQWACFYVMEYCDGGSLVDVDTVPSALILIHKSIPL